MSELSARELRLMLYLDGMLDGDELASFERELEADPTLRAQVEQDRQIMARLGTLLGPSDAGLAALSVPDDVPDQVSPTRDVVTLSPSGQRRASEAQTSGNTQPLSITRFRMSTRVIMGIAAALLVSTLAAVWWWNTTTRVVLPPIAYLQPADIWQRELDDRFIPDWVCEDDEQMLAFTEGRFAEGLLFARVENIEFMGWSYATNLLSGNSASMLATVDGERVLVLVDKIDRDRPLDPPSDRFPELKMFRQEVGSFVLYELTPRDEPAILDLAYSTGPAGPPTLDPPDPSDGGDVDDKGGQD